MLAAQPALGQGNAAAMSLRNSAARAGARATNQWRDARKLYAIVRYKQQPSAHPPRQCLPLEKLQVGQTGLIDCWSFRVLKVASASSVFLISEKGVIQLNRFDTRGLRNEEPVRLLGPIRVDGKSPVRDTNGTRRTALVVHFVTDTELANRSPTSSRPSKTNQTAEEERFQTWHSNAGTEVVAKFVGFSTGKVELLTKDGRSLKLPLSVFTDSDAAELRKLIRAARK
jgi:hypothetical protein